MSQKQVRKALQPANTVVEGDYDLRSLVTPTLQGSLFKLFIWLMKTPIYGQVHHSFARKSNVPQVLSEVLLPEDPKSSIVWTPQPINVEIAAISTVSNEATAASRVEAAWKQIEDSNGSPTELIYPTVSDYHKAYQTGKVTPTVVAERIIAFVSETDALDPRRRWFASFQPQDVRSQAAESTERWRAGVPLSPLDGVPFVVKDCFDALGHETGAGTAFLAKMRSFTEDMPAVALLKQAGAVLLGKANQHEIGFGTSGLNVIQGTPYNPHHPAHYPGGSSSGCAGLVAAGVCPFAIGSDGGGSIRLPASYCGLVGLKPSNGRVGSKGGAMVDFSVSTSGPIAGSVQDCLMLYTLMANTGLTRDATVPLAAVPTPLLPPVSTQAPLKGLSVGVYWEWFEDAVPQVFERCRAVVQLMEQLGAEVASCTVPELEMLRVAHACTIASEMYTQMQPYIQDPTTKAQFNLDVRANLITASFFTAADYLQAQKIRARAAVHFQRVLTRHNVLVTPTTPSTAPPAHPTALKSGEFNLQRTSDSMRFLSQANMLGLPAVSIPVGLDAAGLPIGFQVIGRGWEEAVLLRIAAVLESQLPAAGIKQSTPKMFINPLIDTS